MSVARKPGFWIYAIAWVALWALVWGVALLIMSAVSK